MCTWLRLKEGRRERHGRGKSNEPNTSGLLPAASSLRDQWTQVIQSRSHSPAWLKPRTCALVQHYMCIGMRCPASTVICRRAEHCPGGEIGSSTKFWRPLSLVQEHCLHNLNSESTIGCDLFHRSFSRRNENTGTIDAWKKVNAIWGSWLLSNGSSSAHIPCSSQEFHERNHASWRLYLPDNISSVKLQRIEKSFFLAKALPSNELLRIWLRGTLHFHDKEISVEKSRWEFARFSAHWKAFVEGACLQWLQDFPGTTSG